MTVASQIRTAIAALRRLIFEYGGHIRVVDPYCYGIGPRGNELMRAIQVAGTSASGGFGFGKLWNLADMQHVRVSDECFTPDDPHYNPNDSAMTTILCRV
jgi:hypothetical protein